MIFALVPHRRLHRIQAVEIVEQAALDWIKAQFPLLGAILVGLQESALEGESNNRDANDDQRDP
jgi:hypothetical protein